MEIKVSNKKLSEEDREVLVNSRNSIEFKAYLKLLNILLEEQQKAVLQVDLRTSSDRDLTLLKARSEGAQKLIRDLTAFLSKPLPQKD